MDNNTEQIVLVEDLNPGRSPNDASYLLGSNPSNLAQFSDRLYFAANDGETGRELWVSDGTAAGTQLVADINQSTNDYGDYPVGSNPDNFVEFKERLYFTADDGVTGVEPWVTDGTAEGTQQLKDISPNDGNYVFEISSFANDFTVLGDRLYFTADDGSTGSELWITDGTSKGTQLLKDINPGITDGYFYPYAPSPDRSNPDELIAVGDRLFFVADDGETGRELWTTDGTSEGTQLVKDIYAGSEEVDYLYSRAGKSRAVENPIPFSSYPNYLTEFNGQIYFSADDGVNGSELWVSDGTSEGTKLVKDINPGTSDYGFNNSGNPGEFFQFGDRLYFAAETSELGRELWVTDGTSEGTQLFKDINPNSGDFFNSSSVPSEFIEFEDKFYFSADDGSTGSELWVSDGTSKGTQLVKDLNPEIFDNGYVRSPEGSSISDFTEFDDRLYFVANIPEAGQELWVTDGTSEGTQIVRDLTPGFRYVGEDFSFPFSSYPNYLTVVGNELFFSAEDEEVGRELFKITADDLNPVEKETEAKIESSSSASVNQNTGSVSVSTSSSSSSGSSSSSSSSVSSSSSSSGDSSFSVAILLGGESNDRLTGGSSNDLIDGGLGDDTLIGADGSDTFILDSGAGTDTIVDFEQNTDLIRLGSSLQFEDLTFSGNAIASGEEVLANLNGVNTEQLTANDFEEI